MAAGLQYLQKKDYARAILQFRNAAQATPKDPDVYYRLGVAYAAAQDYTSAVASFQRVLALKPDQNAAQLGIAEIFAHTTNPELLKDAETRLESLLRGSSAAPDTLNALALTELQLGNREDAVQRLQQALAQAPGNLTSALMLARTHLEAGHPDAAETVLKSALSAAPECADAHRIVGAFYLTRHRLPEAEAQLREALAINGKNPAALIDFAEVELAVDRHKEAEQLFRRAAALDGYKHVFGVFLFQEGRHEEAIREFERLVKSAPNDRQARTRLVAAYRVAGATASAMKLLDQALKKDPRDYDALLQRSEMCIQAGNLSQAEGDLNRVIRTHPGSPDVHYVLAKLHQARGEDLSYRSELAESLRLNPDLLPVRLELAQSLISSEAAAAAVDVLNAAPAPQKELLPVIVERNWAYWSTKNFPEMRKGIDEGLAREQSADLLLQDGLLKLQSGKIPGAQLAFEQALRVNPQDLRALTALSQTYLVRKQPEMAVQKVQEYAAEQPNSAPAQDLLGLMLIAVGDRARARAAFVASAAADPLFLRATLDLVRLDAMEEKWDDARDKLKKVIAADGANSIALDWLGDVDINKGDMSAALEDFRKAADRNPRNTRALNNLAYLLAEYGKRPDEALKYAERAAELAPDDPNVADTIGWVLYQKGLYDVAIQHLSRAASRHNIVARYHLAMAYAKAGQTDNARTTLDAALKLNSKLPEAQAALAVVRQAKSIQPETSH